MSRVSSNQSRMSTSSSSSSSSKSTCCKRVRLGVKSVGCGNVDNCGECKMSCPLDFTFPSRRTQNCSRCGGCEKEAPLVVPPCCSEESCDGSNSHTQTAGVLSKNCCVRNWQQGRPCRPLGYRAGNF